MKKLNIDEAKQMLVYVCNYIENNKDFLGKVDSKIGDGDHGIGMYTGMSAAKKKLLESNDCKSINELFKLVGMTMITTMGGASGIIFGTLFVGGAVKVDETIELNTRNFTDIMKKSLKAIKDRGKAELGDKTMVDALEPAVIAMDNCETDSLIDLFYVAHKAALEGVEASKNYVAKFGRAKSLMDRAIGFQDAGATTVALIFQAMYMYCVGE